MKKNVFIDVLWGSLRRLGFVLMSVLMENLLINI